MFRKKHLTTARLCTSIISSETQRLLESWSPQWARAQEVALGAGCRECPTGGLRSGQKPFDRRFSVAATSVCELPGRVWNKAGMCRRISR